jgi:hypothetical protein
MGLLIAAKASAGLGALTSVNPGPICRCQKPEGRLRLRYRSVGRSGSALPNRKPGFDHAWSACPIGNIRGARLIEVLAEPRRRRR